MSLRRWFRGPKPLAHLVHPGSVATFSFVAPELGPHHDLAQRGFEVVPSMQTAKGDFVVFLARDAVPTADALTALAAAIASTPLADVVFGDHAEPDGTPFHKPGWSPALLLAQPYALGLVAYRRELVLQLELPQPDAGVAWDYELLLRATAAARAVCHVPKVICRLGVSRTAHDGDLHAATEATLRMGLAATVTRCPHAPVHSISVRPRQQVPITVIVPSRDRLDLLVPCIESVLATRGHPDLRVLIVDNGSVQPATLAKFAAWQQDPRVRVQRDDAPFDYSALMNRAVAATTTPLVLLLNNDTEVIAPGWLDELAGWLDLPDVGAAGAKLYYADDTIQHAGVVLGIGGVASHGHKGFARHAAGYHGLLHSVRDVSAVTGACLLTRRELYLELGGLEPELRVAYNDIDYCLRLRQRGRRVLWTPNAELHHFEGKSRGDDQRGQARFDREIAFMQARWGALLAADPFYNPNLSLRATDYRRR